jgi:hypothetical protein
MADVRYTVQMRNVRGEWKTIVDCDPDEARAVVKFEACKACGFRARLMRSTVELVDSCIGEDAPECFEASGRKS